MRKQSAARRRSVPWWFYVEGFSTASTSERFFFSASMIFDLGVKKIEQKREEERKRLVCVVDGGYGESLT